MIKLASCHKQAPEHTGMEAKKQSMIRFLRVQVQPAQVLAASAVRSARVLKKLELCF